MSTDQPPLSFNNSNTSTTPNHQARKPSIGDASQLFGGGGSGLDDFFGTSSFSTHPSQSPGVATLHEEPDSFHPTDSSHNVRNGSFDNLYGVNNPVSSSINPAPYGVPHQLPSAAYPHSYAAPSPPTHHYNPNMTQSSADVYNNYAQASYVPNPIHGAENIPNQADTAYSHYSHHSQSNTYAEQTYGHDLHTTGLGISNAPLHSVNNAIPPYPESNPYAPSQLHDNSSTYHPTSSHESPIFNPYDTIPHLSGHIPRSASVGYQPNHDSLNTSSQFLSHSHNQNSSTLSHQSSTASFTRPKGFDAYDPPPIRKKKHMAPSTTGSLPSSPALGYGQTNQFGTANFGSPGTQTPPPPPKQRSISGPAQAPIIPGSETYTSPYLPSDEAYQSHDPHQAQALHGPNLQWSNPNLPIDNVHVTGYSSRGSQQPTQHSVHHSPSFDPYNPNPSLPYATPTYPSNTDHDPYAQPIQSQNIDHRAPVGQNDGSYQGSTSKDIVQRPDDPYAPNNGATVDAYRSTYGVLPNTNGRESPLSTNRSITSSPPMTSHTPDSIPSSTSPKPGQSPSSPTGGNSMAVPFDRKPKRSSPLKTAVSANEDSDSMSSFNAPLIEEPNGVTHPTTPSTEEDLLIEATQKLTLHTANLQCAIETAPSGEAAVSLPEVSQKQSWSASDHVPQKDNSSSSFMTVPAVLIQPATPEMTISGIPEPSPNQTNFDVLADLDQGSVTRSSSNMDHDSYAYDYSTGGTTGPDNSAYDYSLNQTYDQKYQGTHERPQQTFDIYRPPSVSNNVNVPSYYDSYAPTEGQHASDENPYNHSVPLAQGSIGQQNPVGDQYLSHYQPNVANAYEPADTDAPIPSGEPSTRPSSRMLVSESPHLMTSNEAQSYTPSSHYQPASSTDRDGDPSLHRLKAKIPLASFGFGGKLLVVFPSGGQAPSFTSAGYEDPYTSAAKASTGTTLQIHQLSQVIPSIELQAFPGPLFMEGGSKSSVVKKKKEITQWLDERLDETEKECGYLQSNTKTLNTDAGALEAHALKAEQVQDKLLVLKLLKIMIENEGKLSGSPKVDEAVRIALKSVSLRSPTEKTSPSSLPVESLIFEPGLSTPSVSHPSPSDTVATYTVSASNLDRIQALLSHGDRPNALKFASEQKMWAHALVVANSLGHDTWRETVREFVRYELGITISSGSSSTSDSQSNGRESLRALYSLFAGAGPAAMEEFIPPTILSGNSMARSSPSLAPNPYGIAMAVPPSASNSRASSPAPINKPEFRHPTVKLPNETLNQWRTTVALTIANRVPGTTPFLSSLGDTLLSNNRVYAGHACHLLSNGLSPIVGMENGTRISLLGCHMQTSNAGPGLVEAVMLTEVLEFALSLAVVSKGQDTFIGIPHIQGFKLALAYEYATSGSVTIAQKYCESTAAIIKLATKPCPFYHSTLTDQIKALSDRLSAAPVPEKGSSWISRKMPRPTLDNVWQSLEGRVHKFVAGDDEGNTESGNNGPAGLTLPNQAIGPFSHYSSISPASSSGTLSRAQSSSDLRFGVPSFSGPFQHGLSLQRPASGGGFSSSTSYERDPRQRSTSALVTGYSSSDWYSHAEDDDSNPATITQPLLTDSQQNLGDDSSKTATPTTVVPAGGGGGGGGGWWEAAASTGGTPSGSVPPVTFTTFDAGSTPIAADDGSGFIDPMASFGIPSFSTSNNGDFTNYRDDSSKAAYNDDDDDDDLGLGNNNRKKEKSGGGNRGDDDEDPASSDKNGAENQKPTGSSLKPDDKSLKPSPSSSWIGRWFKRDAAAPTNGGPVKANLGEEVSLVYDPETKRWVSRKPGQASTSSSPNTPPPPPARAQTASPTSAMRPPSNGAYPPPPPISRSMTNMPSGTNPPPPSQHRLSQPTTYLKNSNSTSDMGSTQSTSPPPVHVSENAPPSTSSGLPPPPTLTGSKKPATKKSIKSRYVEIR